MATETPPVFFVKAVHDDWFHDGVEEEENLWRLDFSVDDDAFQAQLFLQLHEDSVTELDVAHDPADVEIRYVKAWLFLERDNRAPGSDLRIDYACNSTPLSFAEAQRLLAASAPEVIGIIANAVNQLRALPCDEETVRKSAFDAADLKKVEEWLKQPYVTNKVKARRKLAEKLGAKP